MNRTLCFILRISLLTTLASVFSACSLGFNGFESYSIVRDPNFQSQIFFSPRAKIDILLVVDNSDKMAFVHSSLQNNTNAFVDELVSRNMDFQIAVGLGDAYRKKYSPGDGYQTEFTGTAGNKIINNITSDPAATLRNNLMVGEGGHPDVRGLESLEDILNDQVNGDIVRNFSHFATVFVTTEDDFSNNSPMDTLMFSLYDGCIYNCSSGVYQLYHEDPFLGYLPNFAYYDHTPSNPDPSTGRYLIPITRYDNLVYGKAGVSTPPMRSYSFHTYAIVDHFCRNDRDSAESVGMIHYIAKRYLDLIELTGGGTLGSICQDPANELRRLAQGIISENFRFKLPNYSALVPFTVSLRGGAVIPESTTNGWSFNPTTYELHLHGSSIPRADQMIQVDFHP